MFFDSTEMMAKVQEGRVKESDFDSAAISTEKSVLMDHMDSNTPMSSVPESMDANGNLIFRGNDWLAVLPYDSVDIAVQNSTHDSLSAAKVHVNRPTAFYIDGIGNYDGYSVDCERSETTRECFILTRAALQEDFYSAFLSNKAVGDIISGRVSGFSHSAAYIDLGCGVTALLPVSNMSVNRIQEPQDRLHYMQRIRAVIKSIDSYGRFVLSMRELLGTWKENAALFEKGSTVCGIVRDIMDYGAFIELSPNLAGLANFEENYPVYYGETVLVNITDINPGKMKIRLKIIGTAAVNENLLNVNKPTQYFIPENNHMDSWTFSTPDSPKQIRSTFAR
jgi:small subunit ribosomal protein S1